LERGFLRNGDRHRVSGLFGARFLWDRRGADIPAIQKQSAIGSRKMSAAWPPPCFGLRSEIFFRDRHTDTGRFAVLFGWRVEFCRDGIISLFYFALSMLFNRNPSEDKLLQPRSASSIAKGGAQPDDRVRALRGAADLLAAETQSWAVPGFASYITLLFSPDVAAVIS